MGKGTGFLVAIALLEVATMRQAVKRWNVRERAVVAIAALLEEWKALAESRLLGVVFVGTPVIPTNALMCKQRSFCQGVRLPVEVKAAQGFLSSGGCGVRYMSQYQPGHLKMVRYWDIATLGR